MKKPTSDYFLVRAGDEEHICFATSLEAALAIVARNFLVVDTATPNDLSRILGAGAQILREPEKAKRGPKPKNREVQP